MDMIEIGIAEMAVTNSSTVLVTKSLGSCVGIILYDPDSKIGGLVHVMHPDSALVKSKGANNSAKFADTAVKAMLKKMIDNGAKKDEIVAKLAGGAKMFSSVSNNGVMNIGFRIVDAARTALEKEGIRIVAEDVGKDYGRAIEFDTRSGRVKIKSVGRPVKTI